MAEHPSGLVLDELAAGLEVEPGARAHVESCPSCAQQLKALRAQGEVLLSASSSRAALAALRPLLARPALRRPLRRRLWLGVSSLAGVAAVALLLPRPAGEGARLKGAASLAFLAGDGHELKGPVAPGTRLTLAVGAAGSLDVLVMGVSGDGAVEKLWPIEGHQSVAAPAGAAARLRSFVVTPGSIRCFAFFSSAPLSEETAAQSLRAAVIAASARGESVLSIEPPALPGETGRISRALCVEGSPCS